MLVSRLPGALTPKKSWNSPIKKSEFSNKKSGKKIGDRPEQKVEGYYAELREMVISRNEISKISVFLPKKAGGALRIRVANFVPGKSGFFLYDPVLKTEKKYDSGQKMCCPKNQFPTKDGQKSSELGDRNSDGFSNSMSGKKGFPASGRIFPVPTYRPRQDSPRSSIPRSERSHAGAAPQAKR